MFINVSGTTSTSAQYPTNGLGGATTTNTSSIPNLSTTTMRVTEILVTAVGSNGNIVIADYAGTSGVSITIPVVTTLVVPFPIPIEDGVFPNGVRFTASASGILFTAFFRHNNA